MSVTELLAKLDVTGSVIGLLDHDTQLTRAFVIKAGPEGNRLVERITLARPPAHYRPRRH